MAPRRPRAPRRHRQGHSCHETRRVEGRREARGAAPVVARTHSKEGTNRCGRRSTEGARDVREGCEIARPGKGASTRPGRDRTRGAPRKTALPGGQRGHQPRATRTVSWGSDRSHDRRDGGVRAHRAEWIRRSMRPEGQVRAHVRALRRLGRRGRRLGRGELLRCGQGWREIHCRVNNAAGREDGDCRRRAR